MSTFLTLSVEIELPDDVSDEYNEVITQDITYDPHIERLRRMIKGWVRMITGENCHVEITVD